MNWIGEKLLSFDTICIKKQWNNVLLELTFLSEYLKVLTKYEAHSKLGKGFWYLAENPNIQTMLLMLKQVVKCEKELMIIYIFQLLQIFLPLFY